MNPSFWGFIQTSFKIVLLRINPSCSYFRSLELQLKRSSIPLPRTSRPFMEWAEKLQLQKSWLWAWEDKKGKKSHFMTFLHARHLPPICMSWIRICQVQVAQAQQHGERFSLLWWSFLMMLWLLRVHFEGGHDVTFAAIHCISFILTQHLCYWDPMHQTQINCFNLLPPLHCLLQTA